METRPMRALIDRVLADTAVADNPYFVALREGTFDRADFLETQAQFYFAVVFFSRPMAATAAKIPNAKQRVEILRNVWEEHGEGDRACMHGETFKDLLHRLGGLSADDVERRALWPEVRAFNTALVGCAILDDWEISTACLGMIERMFADISTWIGEAIVTSGWLAKDELTHYKLHAELDIRHADDFFAALAPVWDEGGERGRYLVEQGLRLGATLFDQLYRGLHASRARRALTNVALPQRHLYAG